MRSFGLIAFLLSSSAAVAQLSLQDPSLSFYNKCLSEAIEDNEVKKAGDQASYSCFGNTARTWFESLKGDKQVRDKNGLFVARYYGETGLNFVELESEMIQSGLKVIVKSGTTLPTDELSKRREAIELWGMNAIDPVTLFERLKFPNPEETAQKLLSWKQGQLQQEIQLKQATQGASSMPETTQGRQVQPLPSPQTEMGRMENRMVSGGV